MFFQKIKNRLFIKIMTTGILCLFFVNDAIYAYPPSCAKYILRPVIGSFPTYKRAREFMERSTANNRRTARGRFSSLPGKSPVDMVRILGASGLGNNSFSVPEYRTLWQMMFKEELPKAVAYRALTKSREAGWIERISSDGYYKLTEEGRGFVRQGNLPDGTVELSEIKDMLLHVDIASITRGSAKRNKTNFLSAIFREFLSSKGPLTHRDLSSRLKLKEATVRKKLVVLIRLGVLFSNHNNGHLAIYFVPGDIKGRAKEIANIIDRLPLEPTEDQLISAYLDVLAVRRGIGDMSEEARLLYAELYKENRNIFDNLRGSEAIRAREDFRDRLRGAQRGFLLEIVQWFDGLFIGRHQDERIDVYVASLLDNIGETLALNPKDTSNRSSPFVTVAKLQPKKILLKTRAQLKEELIDEVCKKAIELLEEEDDKDWEWIVFCMWIIEEMLPEDRLLDKILAKIKLLKAGHEEEIKMALSRKSVPSKVNGFILQKDEGLLRVDEMTARRLIGSLDLSHRQPSGIRHNIKILRALFQHRSQNYMRRYLSYIAQFMGDMDPEVRWHASVLRRTIEVILPFVDEGRMFPDEKDRILYYLVQAGGYDFKIAELLGYPLTTFYRRLRKYPGLEEKMREIEKANLISCIKLGGGYAKKTASLAGIPLQTFYRRKDDHGLHRDFSDQEESMVRYCIIRAKGDLEKAAEFSDMNPTTLKRKVRNYHLTAVVKRERFSTFLETTGGDEKKALKMLNVNRKTFYRRLQKYKLEKEFEKMARDRILSCIEEGGGYAKKTALLIGTPIGNFFKVLDRYGIREDFETLEKARLRSCLEQAKGRHKQVARLADMHRATFSEKVNRYGIVGKIRGKGLEPVVKTMVGSFHRTGSQL